MALSQGLSAQRTSRPLVHGHSHSPQELSPAQAESRLRADLDRISKSMEQEESRETLLELAALAVPVLIRALERARSYLSSQDRTPGYAATVLEELKLIRRQPDLFSDSLIQTHLFGCREALWELTVKAPPKLRRELLRAGGR